MTTFARELMENRCNMRHFDDSYYLYRPNSIVRLIRFCRRSRDAEKTVRAREIKIGEKVKAITAGMCPPEGLDTIEKKIALQQEYTRKMEQTKIGKRERERCRELRSLSIENRVEEQRERERDAGESRSDSGPGRCASPDPGGDDEC
jgi:hypothetical protein